MKSHVELREQRLRSAESDLFDVVIIGGGIHGANVCRQATMHGLRCLLLEAEDFAWGITSQSSKMLHGGVRYLEQGDLGLVREAQLERASMLSIAPHLTRPQPFLLPVISGLTRPAWQMRIGLALYDLLAHAMRPRGLESESAKFKTHRRLPKTSFEWETLERLGLKFSGLYEYWDGQMDDTRIAVETVIDSAERGAITLNAARVQKLERKGAEGWIVQFTDTATGRTCRAQGRCLVNTAGPSVRRVHEMFEAWPRDWPVPIYVRGTHLLFDVPWPELSMILPSDEGGRYYFIWPYFSVNGKATLVGPTSVPAKSEDESAAAESEVDELLGYLNRDFGGVPFSRATLTRRFSGMRILAGSLPGRRTGRVSALSRSDFIFEQERYFGLLGGKYTTARITAEKITAKILAGLNRAALDPALSMQPLPGAVGFEELPDESASWGLADTVKKVLGADLELHPELAEELRRTVGRFGSRARQILGGDYAAPAELAPIENLRYRQALYTFKTEQALGPAGVFSRLGLDDFPQQQEPWQKIISMISAC